MNLPNRSTQLRETEIQCYLFDYNLITSTSNYNSPSLKIQSFDLTAENFSSCETKGSSTAVASAKIIILFSCDK